MKPEPNAVSRMLETLLRPWHEAVENPAAAQDGVLHRLLTDYARTAYGRRHGAANVESIHDFRRAFPVTDYESYKPLIDRVMAGEFDLLLAEEPVGWAITRGTTKGESKFIPMTPTDLRQRVSAGRAMMHYVHSNDRYDLFDGLNLNLNFPSAVGQVEAGDRQIEYGYSSGIYAKHVSTFTPIESAPTQEEIDALGGSKTLSAWAKRFELALAKCRDQNITLVGGVCQTALEFARYLRKEHKCYPKQLWRPQIMTLGSAPGINTRYRPSLRALYGSVVIREIYGATEGMFGQQRDVNRAWVPNYDQFFFEVETRSGVKMLHEMRPRELGKLIVSTPILPRYRIGDVILAFRRPYFRCIGRESRWTSLRYVWQELSTMNLNQL
ncbi:MAG: GH3 auxin-responsive promoter family protein [Chloroflexota bacterium]|nr:MAG: GH3 auxin-responsive promoter family protein [Chloroflexota bacterium]